ncbi:MAG: hypothetical protein JOZ46_05750 [Candidatus Dormibacteraeota bacterium]|nr:hypothetical protein [Candidatus Dormibacteraeota bacterium]MBV9525302.1 hypothetical protein [Candidatus Dormibacteraeota bacterium]
MVLLDVVARPRRAIAGLSETARLGGGATAVAIGGLASLGIAVAANAIAGGSGSGLIVALLLPALFFLYWALQAWLVDAAAATLGRRGRRGPFLAVSGYTFPTWIAYALLSLVEALALRFGGAGGGSLSSGLAWLTLPVLGWFLALNVIAVQEVYDVPALNAFAFALLPIAVLTTALVIVLFALGALHAAHVI